MFTVGYYIYKVKIGSHPAGRSVISDHHPALCSQSVLSNWFCKIRIPIFVPPLSSVCQALHSALHCCTCSTPSSWQRGDMCACPPSSHPFKTNWFPLEVFGAKYCRWSNDLKMTKLWSFGSFLRPSLWPLDTATFFKTAKGGVVEKCRLEFVQRPLCTGWPFSPPQNSPCPDKLLL